MADTRHEIAYDKPFNSYKTFTVEVSAPIDIYGQVDEDNTIAENRLLQAVTRELQARGLEAVESGGDLTIKVSSRMSEQTAIYSNGYGYGYPGFYGAGWGYGYGYGGYGGVWSYTYIQGDWRFDVMENSTGDLVYRGEYMDDVGKNMVRETNKAAYKAFKRYPVAARFKTYD
jgi:hypothetical protein